jgi:transcription elongation factor Elf1
MIRSERDIKIIATYHCRGCGQELPPNTRSLFHSECLKRDKRRRVQEVRQRERSRFKNLMSRFRCPRCGAELGTNAKGNPRFIEGPPCEASQDTTRPRTSDGETTGPAQCPMAGVGQNNEESGAEEKHHGTRRRL